MFYHFLQKATCKLSRAYNKRFSYLLVLLFHDRNDTAIMTVKNVDYRWIIHNISKSEVINLLKKSVLEHRAYV